MAFHEQLFRPRSGQNVHGIQCRIVVAFARCGSSGVKEGRESQRVANEQRSRPLPNKELQKLEPGTASVSFDMRRLTANCPG
jgi:hypothetical protein